MFPKKSSGTQKNKISSKQKSRPTSPFQRTVTPPLAESSQDPSLYMPSSSYSSNTTFSAPQDHRPQITEEAPPHQEAPYDVENLEFVPEDVVFCVDIDSEIDSVFNKPTTQSLSRLHAIKQALILFLHSKSQMDSRHRFGLIVVGEEPFWATKLTGDKEVFINAVTNLQSGGKFESLDLLLLFEELFTEAKESRSQNRILRMIMIYNRSSVVPWFPPNSRDLYPPILTCDVFYLHEKPSSKNCPQKVFDSLANTLEMMSQYPCFLFETAGPFARPLFRMMCSVLAHPLQRCEQDYFVVPRDITPTAWAENPKPTSSSAVGIPQTGTLPWRQPSGSPSIAPEYFEDPSNPYSLFSK